jgi:cytochrome c biogenesis protein CcdA
VLSLLFTVSYLGFGVPALAVGILAVPGLTGAAEYYGAALIVFAGTRLLAFVRAEQKDRKHS